MKEEMGFMMGINSPIGSGFNNLVQENQKRLNLTPFRPQQTNQDSVSVVTKPVDLLQELTQDSFVKTAGVDRAVKDLKQLMMPDNLAGTSPQFLGAVLDRTGQALKSLEVAQTPQTSEQAKSQLGERISGLQNQLLETQDALTRNPALSPPERQFLEKLAAVQSAVLRELTGFDNQVSLKITELETVKTLQAVLPEGTLGISALRQSVLNLQINRPEAEALKGAIEKAAPEEIQGLLISRGISPAAAQNLEAVSPAIRLEALAVIASLPPKAGSLLEPIPAAAEDFQLKIKPLQANLSASVVAAEKVASPPSITEVQKPDLPAAKLNNAAERYQDNLRKALSSAGPKTALGRFNIALKLAQELELEKSGKGALANDPQARDILKLREAEIKAQVQQLSQDPEVQAAFKQARQAALDGVFGSQAPKLAQQQFDYITSPEFQNELTAIPDPAARKVRLQEEYGKLAALDNQLASQAYETLAQNAIQEQGLALLEQEGPAGDAAREAVQKTLSDFVDKAKDPTLKSVKVAQTVLSAISSKTSIKKALEKAAESTLGYQNLTDSRKILFQLNKLDPVFSSAFVGLGLLQGSADFLEKVKAGDKIGAVGAAATALDSASHLGNIGKHLGEKLSPGKIAQFGKALQVLEVLGPLGDALGGISDAYAATQEYDNEDYVGAAAKVTTALSGFAQAGAGAYLLAVGSAAGPGAPAVIAVAAVATAGAYLVDTYLGESDLAGSIRKDLSKLGITSDEKQVGQSTHFNQLNVADKVKFINTRLDRFHVSDGAEKEISGLLTELNKTNPAEFIAVIRQIDTAKLGSQLENNEDFLNLANQIAQKVSGPEDLQKLKDLLGRASSEGRSRIVGIFFRQAIITRNDSEPGVNQVLTKAQVAELRAVVQVGEVENQVKAAEAALVNDDNNFKRIVAAATQYPNNPAAVGTALNLQLDKSVITTDREYAIYKILEAVPDDKLIETLQNTDVRKIVSEIANISEADVAVVNLGLRLAQAYQAKNAGGGTPELDALVSQLSSDGRKQALSKLLTKIDGVLPPEDLNRLKSLAKDPGELANRFVAQIKTGDTSGSLAFKKEFAALPTQKQAEIINYVLNQTIVDKHEEKAVAELLGSLRGEPLFALLDQIDAKDLGYELQNSEDITAVFSHLLSQGRARGESGLPDKLKDFILGLQSQASGRKGLKVVEEQLEFSPLQKKDYAELTEDISKLIRPAFGKNGERIQLVNTDDLNTLYLQLKDKTPNQKAAAINQILDLGNIHTIHTTETQNFVRDFISGLPPQEFAQVLDKINPGKWVNLLKKDDDVARISGRALNLSLQKGQVGLQIVNILDTSIKTGRLGIVNQTLAGVDANAFNRGLSPQGRTELARSLLSLKPDELTALPLATRKIFAAVLKTQLAQKPEITGPYRARFEALFESLPPEDRAIKRPQ